MNGNQEPRRRIVSLTITEACNLDCTYCYEHNKTGKTMEASTAKNAIRHEFENSTGFDEVEIDFFGGEPTLHPELIKEVVEWTASRKFGKPYIFFIQTNGTLVHGDFQDWLVANKHHVNVGLSLDGTPTTQDMNRSGSSGMIDVAFFAKNYPEQGVRMTVSNEAMNRLAEDVIYLHGIFKRVDAFFAYGIDWDDTIEDAMTNQMRKLADYYLDNPSIQECSLFDMKLPMIINGGVQKWCGSGVEMVSVGIDGRTYPCHAFQPNTNPSAIEVNDAKMSEMGHFSDPECGKCVLEPICPNCYGINHMKSGDMLKRDKGLCKITKLRAKAVAYLRGEQIARGMEMDVGEKYQNILAIQKLTAS